MASLAIRKAALSLIAATALIAPALEATPAAAGQTSGPIGISCTWNSKTDQVSLEFTNVPRDTAYFEVFYLNKFNGSAWFSDGHVRANSGYVTTWSFTTPDTYTWESTVKTVKTYRHYKVGRSFGYDNPVFTACS